MNDKINLNYLENYAHAFSEKVCSEYFGTKKYMSGQEIIQLTPSTQVNFMVIKALFEKWNEELDKLKSNPFFDYKDMAVAEALKEFMNVLSRAIKIENHHFRPLMEIAVIDTVLLAIDPLLYFWGEIEKSKEENPLKHLKASKKYIKWHTKLLAELIEKGGQEESEIYKNTLNDLYQKMLNELEPAQNLLASLNQVLPIDWNALIQSEAEEATVAAMPEVKEEVLDSNEEESEEKIDDLPISHTEPEDDDKESPTAPVIEERKSTPPSGGTIDPALAWARFESEQSGLLKGPIESLEDGVAINQRFMFTKKLFEGNPDLMGHAFKSIDKCDSFVEAIELINDRYVVKLNWDHDSEEVIEFLHLVYRKFDEK
ncbi:hypothetical protein IFO69_07280 [Echinicola sp. CAU 1574]|uniref:Uncharacterized protein n=1 Tax=Echinicola arenosa TaxID=2774144 RepID=A0ABR9ALP9_9BACT|nr:hypothetical protein [Echinicola arenosa]MBD8488539.1 hypothetical protein [Echinicola arenosa]